MRDYCQYCEEMVDIDDLDGIEYCSKCGHEIISYEMVKYKKGGKNAKAKGKRRNNKIRLKEDNES